MEKIRVIAFYLPQYHPFPQNDEWWGKGFTEWTNVGKAKPLFRGHYEPRVPTELGYYDLRMPSIREEQAQLAREAGIEGFCYYHYWFGNGRTLLTEILEDVIKSGKPDFPFCLCWANHDWTRRTWNSNAALKRNVDLMLMEYPGDEDIVNHFNFVLPAFKDARYMKVSGNPIFVIYNPYIHPNIQHFMDIWNDLAKKNGFPGIHFVAQNDVWLDKCMEPLEKWTFDGLVHCNQWQAQVDVRGGKAIAMLANKLRKKFPRFMPLDKYSYKKISRRLITDVDKNEKVYPEIIPNWDRSPRGGRRAVIYHGSTPKLFKEMAEKAISSVKGKKKENRIIFLKAWNEWGEGNYMEPDLRFGRGYIEALKEALKENK